MVWFVFFFVYSVLSNSSIFVTGQCTVSSCVVSLSGFEERCQVSLVEHDYRLETMNQNMCSAFEKLEAAVNRTNVRGQEKLCHDLKTLYYNMSVHLDNLNEMPECYSTKKHEEYLRFLNLSLTLMSVRTEKGIQAVNESLFSELQTVNRSLDENFQVTQVQFQSQSSTLHSLNSNMHEKFKVMNESVVGALREHDQKLQTMNETLLSAIDKINEKLNVVLDHVNENLQYLKCQDHCRSASVVCDCSDIKANGYRTSGVYCIYVVDQGQRYYTNAFCDMTTTNGGWTVFQNRKDGSVDFCRGWNEYANGFGNPSGELWLGNNFLHLLTSKRRYRLRIDLEDFEGGKPYAEYSTFNISSSADKYRLRIGTYSGTAGNSLDNHNGQRFTTKDSDNDAYSSGNCANACRGAWWYNDCGHSNLNGLYLGGEGIRWYYWQTWQTSWRSLKTAEMKISSS